MDNNVATEIIQEHKKMVMLTGKLSEFQMANLRSWPYVVFGKDTIDYVRVEYDFSEVSPTLMASDSNAGSITYDFFFKDDKQPTDEELKMGFHYLEFWTKSIFWNDTKINFKVHGEKWGEDNG